MPSGLTNAQGQVVFANLVPGNYRVDVFPPATHTDVADQTVAVVAGQEAQAIFRLPPRPITGALRATVTDNTGAQTVLVGVRVDITPVP